MSEMKMTKTRARKVNTKLGAFVAVEKGEVWQVRMVSPSGLELRRVADNPILETTVKLFWSELEAMGAVLCEKNTSGGWS